MDEVSCAANSLDAKLGIFPKQTSKSQEGLDENMADSSGTLNPQLDSSMPEPHLEELQVSDKDGKYKMVEESVEPDMNPEISNDIMLELQSKLVEKTNQSDETEAKLKAAVKEVAMLSKGLEDSQKLLDESQKN
uniref:Uncharacterized protein n=2 Tax=Vitis vinifera TaxID=29760 RepID=A5BC60_VITVI|nr:hypothetical protein VITISV_014983 [Vitis vinifera]